MSVALEPDSATPIAAGPIVWVIDADHWPRALLVAELAERGYDTFGFPDVTRALAALHAPGKTAPSLAVIELSAADPRQAEVRQIASRGIRLLGLTDARSARGALAHEIPWSALMRRPCTIGEIADRVESLLAS